MMRMRHTPSSGLTLIELLVALVVMAVLGIMSWRGIDSALNSREHIVEVSQRWQKLSRGFSLIEHNFLQIAERDVSTSTPALASNGLPGFQLQKLPDGQQRLIYWRMDSVQGARLAGFRLDGDKLMLLRWTHNMPVPAAQDNISAEKLIEGVRNVRWEAMASNGQWTDTWPPQAQAGGLPIGLRLDMDIDDVGHIQRLFALR
ncbi:MAG: hypothetical protein JWM03_869 [Rhodocyclales bacterium]|nr:hypothetical protein [Rhodocyclales bacterium]